MSLAQRVATDLWRIKHRPAQEPYILVTGHELRQCGWSEEQINILDELSHQAETEP